MTVIAKVWAIRERGTLKFLSAQEGVPATHREPVTGLTPTVFLSETNAKLALGAWLKGRVEPYDPEMHYDQNDRENDGSKYGIRYERVESRGAGKMEVVELELCL
jgi:hypothetical protein